MTQERRSDQPVGEGLRNPSSREFDALLETIIGLAAANMVVIETLHEHRVRPSCAAAWSSTRCAT